MTNLGMAMEPRIAWRLREVALMGGGFFQGGNATPAAEFNIFVDPHAAHVRIRHPLQCARSTAPIWRR
jgi:purine nucleosidase